MKHFRTLVVLAAAILIAGLPCFAQYAPAAGADSSRIAGRFVASQYNYSGQNNYVAIGNSATGTATITVQVASIKTNDGRSVFPYNVTTPIIVGAVGSQELITPTAVSNCTTQSTPSGNGTCQITASFANTHGFGEQIQSATGGAAEAAYEAFLVGGGVVVVDNQWAAGVLTGCTACYASANSALNSMVPFASVSIEDDRAGAVQFWNALPSTTTLTAAPTTLTAQAACDTTHQFCSDSTVVGSASWGGTTYGCITLVDLNGNESPCSATASFTSVASKAINIGTSFTARTDNIVGWKPYLSLSAGSYVLAYSVPLLTQPTSLLAVPVSSGVCTLTTLETTTPACAIANSTYGQAGSTVGVNALFKGGAQFTGYPVVTNTLAPEIGSVSALQHNPNEEAHATYAYVPGNHIGIPGVQSQHVLFPITAAAQTTIGEVEGSFPLGANFMNYPTRTIEVCGLISKTSTVADTVDDIQIWWDAEGSNVTAGTPVQLSSIKLTSTGTAAFTMNFCQQLTTTVASTSATGGTIQPGQAWVTKSQTAAGTVPVAAAASLVAAVGSLNLALPAHLSVELAHTTGTDGAGSTLQGATVRIVN